MLLIELLIFCLLYVFKEKIKKILFKWSDDCELSNLIVYGLLTLFGYMVLANSSWGTIFLNITLDTKTVINMLFTVNSLQIALFVRLLVAVSYALTSYEIQKSAFNSLLNSNLKSSVLNNVQNYFIYLNKYVKIFFKYTWITLLLVNSLNLALKF